MFEILILLSKYIFPVILFLFIFQGFLIIMAERELFLLKSSKPIFIQRVLIAVFHILSSLILSYSPSDSAFIAEKLFFALAALITIASANLLYPVIYKHSCKLLWNCMTFILDIGIIMLCRLNFELAQKQLLWIIMGVGLSMTLPYIFKLLPRLDKLKYFYLGFGLFFLIITLFFGITEGGSTSWITVYTITFQPSEPVKLFFVFYLASELCEKITIKRLIMPTVMSCLFILFLVFQKDLGSALIFFMTFMSMLYISTGNAFLITGGFILFSGACCIAYKIFAHVRVRVHIWLDPWSDIEYGGYQIAQSLFAIGTGGVFGIGLTKGVAKDTIPVVERDFIFSAICEEFGVLFAVGFIIIFLIMFFRGVRICIRCKNKFLVILSAGLTSMLCLQSFLIIGGVIKLIPLTGVTLPFVSYGGSSMVISFMTIGILQWISTVKIGKKRRVSNQTL